MPDNRFHITLSERLIDTVAEAWRFYESGMGELEAFLPPSSQQTTHMQRAQRLCGAECSFTNIEEVLNLQEYHPDEFRGILEGWIPDSGDSGFDFAVSIAVGEQITLAASQRAMAADDLFSQVMTVLLVQWLRQNTENVSDWLLTKADIGVEAAVMGLCYTQRQRATMFLPADFGTPSTETIALAQRIALAIQKEDDPSRHPGIYEAVLRLLAGLKD